MHFITFFTMALIAFTSTTSAGALHDRRRDNRLQMMRRNRGPNLHARHNGQHPGGVEAPASSAPSTPGLNAPAPTAIEGLNSTLGLNATATTVLLGPSTTELVLTSDTAPIDATACPSPVTATVTETVLAGGETQTDGEQTSIVTTLTESLDPALTKLTSVDPSLPLPTDGNPPFTFITSPSPPPAATNIAEIQPPSPGQPAPTPIQDGDVTTQIFTQTISSPAATQVFESTIRRGRNRGKVVTITEESEESVEVETVTLVVTQEGRVELVTSESGVAAEPTAIIQDGIAVETPAAAPAESAAPTEATEAAQTSLVVEDGNAAVETSTSCTDAGVTITSAITVDASAPAATESAAPDVPDSTENVVSMISVITLTKSAEPFITTTDIDGVPALTSVTPAPEVVLSTITLVDGGVTGTGTDGAAPIETDGARGNGKGRGKGKGRKKNKNKGKGKGSGKDDDEEEDGNENENGAGNGNGNSGNQKNAGGRGGGNGRGSGEYGVDD